MASRIWLLAWTATGLRATGMTAGMEVSERTMGVEVTGSVPLAEALRPEGVCVTETERGREDWLAMALAGMAAWTLKPEKGLPVTVPEVESPWPLPQETVAA